jgi:hypothetical protein
MRECFEVIWVVGSSWIVDLMTGSERETNDQGCERSPSYGRQSDARWIVCSMEVRVYRELRRKDEHEGGGELSVSVSLVR